MTDQEEMLHVSHDASLGKVEIAPEVIEIITGIAAAEVEGIASMRGTFATDVAERFGKRSHSKGVKVDITNDGAVIDLFVVIRFGTPIKKTAETLQQNVKQALHNMAALDVKAVNVHIVGIDTDDSTSPSEEEN